MFDDTPRVPKIGILPGQAGQGTTTAVGSWTYWPQRMARNPHWKTLQKNHWASVMVQVCPKKNHKKSMKLSQFFQTS